MRRKGFTVIELLVVVAIIGILATLTASVCAAARSRARMTTCAVQMRSIHVALLGYTAENFYKMPPFRMPLMVPDLPLSCHFGGVAENPDVITPNDQPANLWVLAAAKMLPQDALVCPAAARVMDPQAGYFPAKGHRFSTYSLRMPYSMDLFRSSNDLALLKSRCSGNPFAAYQGAPGGGEARFGKLSARLPQVRIDMRYRSDGTSRPHTIDMSSGAWVVDGFWRREYSQPATDSTRAVQQDWCHGDKFNVLDATGAVRRMTDSDGIIRQHSQGPEGGAADDGVGYATHSEEVWRFFDGK